MKSLTLYLIHQNCETVFIQVGNHINVETGIWTAVDAGIGAGVDSYFEYLVKGSVLFNEPMLMDMFKGIHLFMPNVGLYTLSWLMLADISRILTLFAKICLCKKFLEILNININFAKY